MDPDLLQIIKNSELFSLLGKEKLEKLIQLMEIVNLRSGNTLFRQGEESNCFYLVLRGTLIASYRTHLGEERMVGIIKHSEPVGEMGLITGRLRTLTVKAARNAILLKINKDIYTTYFVNEIEIILKFLHLIISRYQIMIRSITQTKKYSSIAILPANEDVVFADFIIDFTQQIPPDTKMGFVSYADFQKDFTEEGFLQWLDDLHKENDFVFYKIDSQYKIPSELFLATSDRIVLVANGNSTFKFDNFSASVLANFNYSHIKKELVLIYPEDTIKPQNAHVWLEKKYFSLYHHVRKKNASDHASLMRFTTGKAIGLVLSGGGTKGWLHVGVIKALVEANIPIDIVGGTSIGAVVGASFLMEPDFAHFVHKMKDFSRGLSKPFSFKNFTYPIISILSGKAGTLELKKLFGEDNIEDLWRPFFCISCNISKASTTIKTKGILWKWLRASSALPGLVPPVEENGELYVDGGVIDTLPVQVMRHFLDGKGKIIAISLSRAQKTRKYNFPPIITFWDALLIKLKLGKQRHYRFPDFQELLLKSLLIGSEKFETENAAMADVLINPDLTDYATLSSFSKAQQLMEMGYEFMKDKLDIIKENL